MADVRNRCLKAGMRVFSATGGHRLLAPFTEGVGLVFMLHQVCPVVHDPFDPNRILRISPQFLDRVICRVKQAGLDIVSLDEAHRRLTEGDFKRRFACFTLDDGYQDNKEHAFPIFKKHDCPFTIYVPGHYPDGGGILWWQALQDIIATQSEITVPFEDRQETFKCDTVEAKWQAFNEIYWWMRSKPHSAQLDLIKRVALRHDYDLEAQCKRLIMSWDDIRELARDPLTTIGAHTMNHATLSKLSDDELYTDTQQSIERLTGELGYRPRHMSYPYGDPLSAGAREFDAMKKAGFKTAITTRKGVLFPEHKDHLTALPRVSLNGEFQDETFIDLYLSGSIFAVWNGFKRLNVS